MSTQRKPKEGPLEKGDRLEPPPILGRGRLRRTGVEVADTSPPNCTMLGLCMFVSTFVWKASPVSNMKLDLIQTAVFL